MSCAHLNAKPNRLNVFRFRRCGDFQRISALVFSLCCPPGSALNSTKSGPIRISEFRFSYTRPQSGSDVISAVVGGNSIRHRQKRDWQRKFGVAKGKPEKNKNKNAKRRDAALDLESESSTTLSLPSITQPTHTPDTDAVQLFLLNNPLNPIADLECRSRFSVHSSLKFLLPFFSI